MSDLALIRKFFRDRFSLDRDRVDPAEVIEQVRQNIFFRGTNLWILIFAIFLASIGLNVNSTAVIIGAMLISPLMGPIIGIGLGAGINDFKLMRKAFANLVLAMFIGLVTSALYFSVTPLNEAHSELLARTNPTVWDVFIALFGGLAGIIAASSKERGNVIPGVAIATALMPPLCTAGYGLAVGNFYYFGGAFYLFFINCVYICAAAYIVARALKFPYVEYPDQRTSRHVKRIVMAIVLITFIPSVYIAWITVKRSIYEQNATEFVNRELRIPNTYILNRHIQPGSRSIKVIYIGKEIDSLTVKMMQNRLPDYNLSGTTFILERGTGDQIKEEYSELKSQITEELFRKTQQELMLKDDRIEELEYELEQFRNPLQGKKAADEFKALFPGIGEIGVARTTLFQLEKGRSDTLYLVYCTYNKLPRAEERGKLESFLKARLGSDRVRLVLEKR